MISKIKNISFDQSKLAGYYPDSITENAEQIGISKQHLSNIINGKKKPSADVLVRICIQKNIPISDLAKNN